MSAWLSLWYWLCPIVGHRYRHIRALSDCCQQAGCDRCRRVWAINHCMRIILPWDYELEMLYRPGGGLHTSRTEP